MEVALNQEQTEIQAREIRTMTQTRAWKILEARLGRLLEHRGTELANHLRKADFNRSIYLQGFLDGVESISGEVKKMSNVNPTD